MYIRDTRERTGDEKSTRRESAKQRIRRRPRRTREREREKEAVVVVVSKVEGLKSSYHFFVVYLCVCFYV
jgi:hypothetical protein